MCQNWSIRFCVAMRMIKPWFHIRPWSHIHCFSQEKLLCPCGGRCQCRCGWGQDLLEESGRKIRCISDRWRRWYEKWRRMVDALGLVMLWSTKRHHNMTPDLKMQVGCETVYSIVQYPNNQTWWLTAGNGAWVCMDGDGGSVWFGFQSHRTGMIF